MLVSSDTEGEILDELRSINYVSWTKQPSIQDSLNTSNLANELYEEALKFNMSVIVEVHTVEEAKKALNFKEALIGINNRDLKTLKTDINTTYDIHNVLILSLIHI